MADVTFVNSDEIVVYEIMLLSFFSYLGLRNI